eukprot:6383531-Pyramimonas_sp.AAC.1
MHASTSRSTSACATASSRHSSNISEPSCRKPVRPGLRIAKRRLDFVEGPGRRPHSPAPTTDGCKPPTYGEATGSSRRICLQRWDDLPA